MSATIVMGDTGETKVPEQEPECMKRYRHAFTWVWDGEENTMLGRWTNTVRCMNCGETKVHNDKVTMLV